MFGLDHISEVLMRISSRILTDDLIVLAKPLRPEGPLEVDGVYKDKCHVKCKRPKDTGGLPVDKYLFEVCACEPELHFYIQS